ncbi:MAG: DsbA family protein [Deltaproteobacteria bacterium]|nr:DsbA family protein [Deltaproteobacteria bacterium]
MKQLLVPVGAHDHARGPVDAHVTIVQYGDYDCPHTRLSNRILVQLLPNLPVSCRFIYRHFPLRHLHANAQLFAELAEAAADQGRFWPFHDRVMSHSRAPDEAELRADLHAADLDLDGLARAITLKVRARVEDDLQGGKAAGVHSTPTFFFNGVLHEGHYDPATVRGLIDAAANRL